MAEISQDKESKSIFTFQKGLGRTIFVSFMCLALIPLLVSGWLSYHNARSSLLQKEVKILQTALSLRTLYFESYFQERLNDLVLQADLSENVFLLNELRESYRNSGLPLSQFVNSYDYTRIVTEHSLDLQDYQERAGYSNIYLIDIGGDILYSITQESDLGTNLFTGLYHETDLANLCRLALKTGRPLSSDLTIHIPSGNQKTLFTAKLMVDESGDEIGFLVMQIKLEKIDALMADVSGLGATGQVFLVGNNGTLRSSLRNDPSRQVLSTQVNNPLVTEWLAREEIRHGVGHEDEKEGLVLGNFSGTSYKGESGKKVLGISRDLDSLGQYDMHWLMIAEIDEGEVLATADNLRRILITMVSTTAVFILLLAAFLTSRMILPLVNLTEWAKQVSSGDLVIRQMSLPSNEIGTLYNALFEMVNSLRQMLEIRDRQDWFKTGETGLDREMRGEEGIAVLGQNILDYLCRYLDLSVGAFFAYEKDKLRFTAGYAYTLTGHEQVDFAIGEGLVGQAAQDRKKIYLKEPAGNELDLEISSGFGVITPRAVLIIPLVRDNKVLGVLEFGSNRLLTGEEIKFLEQVSESVSIAIQSSNSRQQLQSLLRQTQEQAEQLQAREEELMRNNREMERANVTLEKTGIELEKQSALLQEQADQLKQQQKILEERNKKIELSSKYKSEFLANMSHELRTPLNSILLLSSLMAANKDKALSESDVESVATINKAGNDLLNLINEVLDLAKVESGRMEMEVNDVNIADIARHMKDLFQPICENKGIAFHVTLDEAMPQSFLTDQFRVEQILKNFISNSCKFTKKGAISLRIGMVRNLEPELLTVFPENLQLEENLAFTVTDTGIGIAKEKQDLIFEAFQQADGSTCRQYGGTGLGLSISREIAKLLGGGIAMTSEPGHGSTFALVISEQKETAVVDGSTKEISNQTVKPSVLQKEITASEQEDSFYIADDRENLQADDKVLLIIDDDPDFVKVVRDLARNEHFKVLAAKSGETGLQLTDLYTVTAIILDIGLPVMSGWSVLSRLKEADSTRHIPVYVISASDRSAEALKMGSLNFLTKPVESGVLNEALGELKNAAGPRKKRLLLVEDDANLSVALKNLLMADDIEMLHADTGVQALSLLDENVPDCIVLDLGLPDMDGEELLGNIQNTKDLKKIPIIVYTGKELTPKQKFLLDQCARTTILKGATSHEQLLAEITLFMHRVEKDIPQKHQEIIHKFYNREDVFVGKKILLVDDDMRNVFSLRKILADKSMDVVVGKNGKEALAQLQKIPDVDLVLMDIMMPVMDGFEAMAKIRKEKRFKNLPIIALTAKAMKGDREKCIDAGASDYLTKPIDTERLFSMLRSWLYGRDNTTKDLQ